MFSYSLVAFFLYFSILILIGIISHEKQDSNKEFIVGNRSLNFWLTALSAHASDMSAWLFMGLPMAVFLQGISGSWIAIGLFSGMLITWQFIAKKLRESTEKLQSFTLSTYFENRFSDHTGILRLTTAIMLLFFLTHYLSAGLIAMGLLLESVFSIDYYWGLSFATLVIVAYTFGGGFVTIAWTDFFQAIFLLCVIVIVPIIALCSLDHGIADVLSMTHNHPHFLSLTGEMSTETLTSSILIAIAWGLGYLGMPHVITKFMGIKDARELKKSQYLGMSWQFIALSASVAVGIVGAAFFQHQLDQPQLVFVDMVKALFHPFFAGFVLCGVLAANLSTMDSQLLVCASVIGEDLFGFFSRKKVLSTTAVRASRFGVVVVALVALMIAYHRNETILDTVLYAWAGLGSAFGPLVLMSLYWKKTNVFGAISGILIGGVVSLVWPTLSSTYPFLDIPAMLPGFSLSLLAIFLVSLVTQSSLAEKG